MPSPLVTAISSARAKESANPRDHKHLARRWSRFQSDPARFQILQESSRLLVVGEPPLVLLEGVGVEDAPAIRPDGDSMLHVEHLVVEDVRHDRFGHTRMVQ